jgi:hypothetical protein
MLFAGSPTAAREDVTTAQSQCRKPLRTSSSNNGVHLNAYKALYGLALSLVLFQASENSSLVRSAARRSNQFHDHSQGAGLEMFSSGEQEAIRIGNALNNLGHLAAGHPLEELRRSKGDAQLRKIALESATLLLELVIHEEKRNPEVVPRSAEVKAALSQVRDLVQSVAWDDAESMEKLRASARQALESFGFGLPE